MPTASSPETPQPPPHDDSPGPELAPEPGPGPGEPEHDLTPRRPRRSGIVEEFIALATQSGGLSDPVLSKMRPEHIRQFLEISASRQGQLFRLRQDQQKAAERFATKVLLFLGFVLLLTGGLCWLFLHYGKTEQVFNLIALIFTGGGGIGLGIGGKRIAATLKGQPEPDETA